MWERLASDPDVILAFGMGLVIGMLLLMMIIGLAFIGSSAPVSRVPEPWVPKSPLLGTPTDQDWKHIREMQTRLERERNR